MVSAKLVGVFVFCMLSIGTLAVFGGSIYNPRPLIQETASPNITTASSKPSFVKPLSLAGLLENLNSIGATSVNISRITLTTQVEITDYNDFMMLARNNVVFLQYNDPVVYLYVTKDGIVLTHTMAFVQSSSGLYTRFEKIEVTSAYCQIDATLSTWNITLDVRNTGTTDSSIINVFVNSKKVQDYGGSPYWINVYDSTGKAIDFGKTPNPDKMTIVAGQSAKLIVTIAESPTGTPAPYSFGSGTTVEVSMGSAAGNSYMKMITLT